MGNAIFNLNYAFLDHVKDGIKRSNVEKIFSLFNEVIISFETFREAIEVLKQGFRISPNKVYDSIETSDSNLNQHSISGY